MEMVLSSSGAIRCVYGEAIDLNALGSLMIQRASHVEPDSLGHWQADLALVQGPMLGPFATRSQALAAEQRWLLDHWLIPDRTH